MSKNRKLKEFPEYVRNYVLQQFTGDDPERILEYDRPTIEAFGLKFPESLDTESALDRLVNEVYWDKSQEERKKLRQTRCQWQKKQAGKPYTLSLEKQRAQLEAWGFREVQISMWVSNEAGTPE